jgi:hypothetical protein
MTFSRRSLPLVVVVFAFTLFAIGCGGDGETASIEVRVVSDLVPFYEAATATVVLYEGVATASTGAGTGSVEKGLTVGEPLARGVWLAKFEGVPLGTYTVWVRLARASGEFVGRQPITFTLSDDASFTVTLTADCAAVECPGSGNAGFLACRSGQCVDPRCSPETPELCPADLPPFCEADGDCEPSSACGIARCAGGACLQEADARECGEGEFCSAISGCTLEERPADAPVDVPGICGDACTVESAPCSYAYVVCTGGASECTASSPRPAGSPCPNGGLCDPNGTCIEGLREDGGVADMGVSEDLGVTEDMTVLADMDVATDMTVAEDMTVSPDMGATPCATGYLGTVETGCYDINECTYNVCDARTTCTNTPGGFSCSACPEGFAGTGETGCERENGCDDGPCDALTVCNTTGIGTYECSACPPGYLGTGERGCFDIDECTYNVCDRLTTCSNTAGGFECSACPDGFEGTGETGCDCPAGFVAGSGGDTCNDVDECLTDNGGCSVNAACGNTVGSRTCTCNSGFTGDGVTCTPTWTQNAYVKASNTGATDMFGYSVSLSSDGSRLAVGVRYEDSNATGVGGDQTNDSADNSGAVYVFARTGPTWAQEAYIKASNTGASDGFGISVSLSSDGSRLAVGAAEEDSNATGIGGVQTNDGASEAGAVYVFARTGLTWAQEAYVKASNTGANDQFGWSVSLSSDGSRLAVGAPIEASNTTGIGGNQADDSALWAGAVYVFARTGPTWAQEAYIKASNTGAREYFGWSVSLSSDGSRLAVGANREASNATGIGGDQANNSATDSGAVYVFARTGPTWAQEAYVKASNTGAGDQFGHTISLSSDGSRLAVGTFFEDSNATGIGGDQANDSAVNSGAVYVFARTGSIWAQEAYVKASNTEANDFFGFGVSLSSDGSRLAVGSLYENSNATGIGGDQTNNSLYGAGSVYVFARTGPTWTQEAYIKASNTGFNDVLGYSVSLSSDGSRLAVGAINEASNATGIGGDQTNNSASQSGATYTYVFGP